MATKTKKTVKPKAKANVKTKPKAKVKAPKKEKSPKKVTIEFLESHSLLAPFEMSLSAIPKIVSIVSDSLGSEMAVNLLGTAIAFLADKFLTKEGQKQLFDEILRFPEGGVQ